MALVSMGFVIMDGLKKAPPPNADPIVFKEYQMCIKKSMSIMGLNYADNQLTHIKSCKRLAKAWKTLCNIHKRKSLSNILFCACKMEKDNTLLITLTMSKCL